MRPSPVMFSVAVALGLVASGAAWSVAHAQAWVGEQGSLNVGLDYNLAISDSVYGDVEDFPDAGTTSHQITLAAEYTPIDRLAVTVALPFLALKYTGDKMLAPHPGGGRYDDGATHATPTDLRFGARYQVLEEPLALAPHIGVSIPLADYETVGNAVAGRHLKALHLGLGLGKAFLGTAYVHLLYEYSLVERYDRTPVTKAYGQNRSDLAFTLGYKLLEQRLDIHLGANARIPHGGVNFSQLDFFRMPLTDEVLYHDAILKEQIILAGAGVAYQLTNALAVSLSGRAFVTGKNTQNANVLAVGFAWAPL
jgi:hypothetical protein